MDPSRLIFGLIAALLGGLALFAGSNGPALEDSELEEDGGPAATPKEVAFAIRDEILSQADPKSVDKLSKFLNERLMRVGENSAQIAVPCDMKGAMPCERISEMSLAIAESYQIPMSVELVSVRSSSGRTYPFSLVTIGNPVGTSSVDWISEGSSGFGSTERFGGIVDLIVNSFVSSFVGLFGTRSAESLLQSLGGERRLARLMRHRKTALSNGNQDRAERIKEKILRSAARIKGKEVDWTEIEALSSGQSFGAEQPVMADIISELSTQWLGRGGVLTIHDDMWRSGPVIIVGTVGGVWPEGMPKKFRGVRILAVRQRPIEPQA